MSLQFHSRSGYFYSMARPSFPWVVAGILAGCGQRDRLTFPVEDPGDGSGPFTNITQPAVADTVAIEGDLLILTGYSVDPDGIDSVFFEVTGANQAFSPIKGNGADSVAFALQISTLGNSGASVLVRAFAKDGVGDVGPAAVRSITIE